ncbi:MAG: hypothetical protein ACK55I_02260 [bacterium]
MPTIATVEQLEPNGKHRTQHLPRNTRSLGTLAIGLPAALTFRSPHLPCPPAVPLTRACCSSAPLPC